MMHATTVRRMQGFSMLEMIVVVVISGVALAGIWEYSVFQKRVGLTQAERIDRQTDTALIMQFLGQDVAKAGFGIMEVPGGATPTVSEIMANDMALSTLDAGDHPSTRPWLDSMTMLSGTLPLASSDQLVLGSTLYSNAAAVKKMAIAVQASSATAVDVYRMEGTASFTDADYFMALSPASVPITRGTALDANLLGQVFDISAVNTLVGPGLSSVNVKHLEFLNLGGIAAPMRAGSELYGIDYFGVFTLSGFKQKFNKVQYALVDSGRALPTGARLGKLVRYKFKGLGSVYTAANIEQITVAEDVLDFQVQYLVWPCNTAAVAPVWTDQPDAAAGGFYDMTMYAPTTGTMTSPYLNRRMRILGVKIIVFSAAEKPLSGMGVHQIHLPTGVNSFQVANHLVTGLETTRHYILHEEVFDPINFRFRDENWVINDSQINLLRMKLGKCQLVR